MIPAALPVVARTPQRPAAARSRRILLPVIGAASALGMVGAAQLVFDPFHRDVPLCPLHAMTGLDCPGCGLTRAVHALLAGDPLLALRCNALIAVLVPTAIVIWARWTWRRWHGRGAAGSASATRPLLVVAAVTAALAFTVLRNLSAFWFLAPPGP